MNPLLGGYSGTTPEMSRNVLSINQGTNEDDSQSNPYPEAGLLTSGREERHDMATGVQRERERERVDGCHMVTGVIEKTHLGRDMVTGVIEKTHVGRGMVTGNLEKTHVGCDMVTGVHEEITYCSPSTSSGKQKRNRSTSQHQFRSENTPATIEADQILLALQQLANNNNSVNFHNNINRISKLPKSLTTTMPTFDRNLKVRAV